MVTKEQRKINIISSLKNRFDEETYDKIVESGILESYEYMTTCSDYANIRNIIRMYNEFNHADLIWD